MIRPVQMLAFGAARGTVLVLARPLSFWGGVDARTGKIIDASHPDRGCSVQGRVLAMPGGRGSSSSASVLAEALRRGTGPVAIVIERPDPILAVGALVAQSLYGIACPIAVCLGHGLATGMVVSIHGAPGDDATLVIEEAC
ncbi:MAG: DUF126 domain-containing protein [Thermohalobaculum sp.]|nr:DUF126 domain-containing protein [Thermohalobaculum sp.]